MSVSAREAPVRGILDVLVFSSLTGVGVVIAAAVNVTRVFAPEGVAVRLPLASDPATLTIEGATNAAQYAAADATVLVPGVATGALVAFAASILIAAVAALIILAGLIQLALSFRAGRLFTRSTSRALTLIGGVLFGSSCIVLLTDAFGRAGAYTALGLAYEPIHMLDLVPYLPLWVAAIFIAMLAGVFERGQRMQRETEGLV